MTQTHPAENQSVKQYEQFSTSRYITVCSAHCTVQPCNCHFLSTPPSLSRAELASQIHCIILNFFTSNHLQHVCMCVQITHLCYLIQSHRWRTAASPHSPEPPGTWTPGNLHTQDRWTHAVIFITPCCTE